MAYKLEYFNIEGAGEKVRLAMILAGIEFEDVRIPFNEWPARKATAKFGQLPILTLPDGREIYQSPAMLRYIGNLNPSIYPEDIDMRLKMDEMLGLLDDLQRAWFPCFLAGFSPDRMGHSDLTEESKTEIVKALRTNFVENELPKFLQFLTDALNANEGGFLCGSAPTIVDCQALPQLRYFCRGIADFVPDDCMKTHPEILAYINRMMEVPQVREWYEKKE